MNTEEMQIIGCRVCQRVGNRKRKKIQNRSLNAIDPYENRYRSRPGFGCATGGRDVLPGNQQGEVVRGIVIELE